MTETRRPYQLDDLYQLKTVVDPQLSPDGRRVAFVVTEIDKEADGYRSAIWLVEVDGDEARRLTYGGKNEGQPRWSPDGRWLAFVSNRENGQPQLHILSSGGGEARRLTNVKRGVGEIAWSPDSASIAFIARTGGPDNEKNGNAPRVITTIKHKFNGQGFSDGSRRHIFTIPLAGGEPRQITDGEWDDGQIAWSPDGHTIAFVSARHEGRDRDLASDLWLVSAEGGEARRLTERFGSIEAPAWSPDGSTIAFAGHNDPDALGERTHSLWLILAAGGAARNLTSAFDRSIQAGPLQPGAPPARFCWTADGAAILARLHDGADVHLYRFTAADGSRTLLLGGTRCMDSFSAAGERIACTLADHTHPAEVFLLENGQERKLTSINDALLNELRLPETEPVSVRLPDGAVIEGWVWKPLEMEPGKQYPLVLDIHGGPHGAFFHNFRASYPVLLASAGCAVLQMNPRGSTGWGEDFARFLHGGRGERDLPELLAAVDQVIAQGWVDPERLGITGYSYGGYMTAWGISQTRRFKAAVWGAGTANLYTHFAYSDITLPRFHEMGGSPWEQREAYLRQSPISYVQEITTPLLMLHGEADLRCKIEQAEEFFTALRYFGKEAVLVRYPGENHMMPLGGRPTTRIDYSRRLLDWFTERLGLMSAAQEQQAVAAD